MRTPAYLNRAKHGDPEKLIGEIDPGRDRNWYGAALAALFWLVLVMILAAGLLPLAGCAVWSGIKDDLAHMPQCPSHAPREGYCGCWALNGPDQGKASGQWEWFPPCASPTPSPMVTPTPEPTPDTCANRQCPPGTYCVEFSYHSDRALPPETYHEIPQSHCAPTPQPSPTPTPQASCPASPVPMAKRQIMTKIIKTHPATHKPGKIDSTPRVNDQAYCQRATGQPGISTCKANPEGSGYRSCDTEFLGAACPVWQWSTNAQWWARCLPQGEGGDAPITCDHFDDWGEVGPYTGPCERNKDGNPISGFVMVAHGKGWVRSCSADKSACSDPVAVDF